MPRKRYKAPNQMSHEFELDLAPLLAVMVKLVPVLLVSSGFLPLMMIETDLPQVVKEAIQREPQEAKKKTHIAVEMSKKTGFRIVIIGPEAHKVQIIALTKEGKLDLEGLHLAMRKIKGDFPEVFRLELAPESDVNNQEIVDVMDVVRKSKDKSVKFPVFDQRQGKDVLTDFMFPEVVFSNILEG